MWTRAAAWPLFWPGLLGTALSAWAATGLDVQLLRRCFGVYLLYVGVTELFRKKNKLSPGSGGG